MKTPPSSAKEYADWRHDGTDPGASRNARIRLSHSHQAGKVAHRLVTLRRPKTSKTLDTTSRKAWVLGLGGRCCLSSPFRRFHVQFTLLAFLALLRMLQVCDATQHANVCVRECSMQQTPASWQLRDAQCSRTKSEAGPIDSIYKCTSCIAMARLHYASCLLCPGRFGPGQALCLSCGSESLCSRGSRQCSRGSRQFQLQKAPSDFQYPLQVRVAHQILLPCNTQPTDFCRDR